MGDERDRNGMGLAQGCHVVIYQGKGARAS